MNISGVHSSANNISTTHDRTLDNLRSSKGSSSEADYRALSKKDSASVTKIRKDELAYEYNLAEWDQMKEWDKDEAEKYRLFQD